MQTKLSEAQLTRLIELFAATDPKRLQLATQEDSTEAIASAMGIDVDELISLVEIINANTE